MKKTKKEPGGFFSPVAKLFDRQHKPLLHTIEWIFILLAFFAVSLPILYFESSKGLFGEGKLIQIGSREEATPPMEAEKKFIGEEISEPIDTSGWSTYRNKWYGFEIQHPESWTDNTQYKTATEKSARYDIIYKFRKDGEESSDTFSGYDVKIYSVRKVQEIENTNEIRKKDNAPAESSECSVPASEESLESGGPTLQKISINEDNPCYEPAYFYSYTKGSYIYNIVPAVGESGERFPNPEEKTSKAFPEYKEAVASFKNISLSKPAMAPAKPRITARRPVSAKISGGRLVCAKKNDHPHKSDKNKPGHLDLECCLDPDERPNPWCSY
jgi:hypothetical protein